MQTAYFYLITVDVFLLESSGLMQVLDKIQLSEKQIDVLNSGGTVVIPASWEEFEAFLAETDYRIEDNNDHIIIMGLATIIHELLVAQIVYLLKGFYVGKPFYVAGSNVGIRKDGRRKHHNGDVVVIKDKPLYQGESRSIITNPYLIVEVLSEATLDYDLGNKRRLYEQIESLQELVFVDPANKEVLVCRRTERANVWIETTYRQPDDEVVIDGNPVSLKTIFENLPSEE